MKGLEAQLPDLKNFRNSFDFKALAEATRPKYTESSTRSASNSRYQAKNPFMRYANNFSLNDPSNDPFSDEKFKNRLTKIFKKYRVVSDTNKKNDDLGPNLITDSLIENIPKIYKIKNEIENFGKKELNCEGVLYKNSRACRLLKRGVERLGGEKFDW